MSTTKLTRVHPETQDLRRVVVPEKREARTAIRSESDEDVQLPDSQVVASRSRLLGAHGGLDRILMALMRQLNQGSTTRAHARASADRLHETIRVLSVL
jgi:hypothetical protein